MIDERTEARHQLDVDADAVALTDLRTRLVFRPVGTRRLEVERVAELVRDRHTQSLGQLVLELTARHPHADAGFADFYHPGRWDCATDLVFMTSIHQIGPSVGEWDGTVGYAQFTAPDAATYIVAVNFSGYQQTMRLNGPWGTSTAYTPTTSDSAAATAIWNGAAGEQLYCTFSSRSDDGYSGIAYLDSFQIFTPA